MRILHAIHDFLPRHRAGSEIYAAELCRELSARHHVTLRMGVELPTIESIKRFVEMGMGVAIVPRMCVQVEAERGQLVEVRIREMRLRRDLFLIFRRDRPLSQPAKAFLRLLRPKQSLGSLVANAGD